MPIVSTKGLSPKQSELTERELKHLLRRTTFGLSKDQLTHYQNRTLDSVIDELLTITSEYEQPLNFDPDYKNYEPQDVYGQTWVYNPLAFDPIRIFQRKSLHSNFIQKHIISQDINEKLTMFFHHFIPIGDDDQRIGAFYWNYRFIRDSCLRNFKDIILKITKNMAMLIYLNGENNNKDAPDENYARELMELFTLGKNYTPIYSETDIKEAAKVLTGYGQTNTTYGYTYYFNPLRHDSTDKTFSSFFNNAVIKGKSGPDGEKELDDLLNMIFEKEEVSIYFVTRLYRFFVYYEIDDTIKNNIILPLAKIMRDNNYEIKPVLKALFKSEHFYDTNVIGSHIKNPLDLLFGATKEFNFKPVFSTLKDRYLSYLTMYKDKLVELGMFPYYATNVAGWPAYYQEPLFYENWITTSTFLKRVEFLNSFFTNFGDGYNIDVIEAAKKHSNPSNINALIDDVQDWHLTIEPTADIKAHMKSILLYGQTEDHYWTDLWNTYTANPWDNKVKKQLESILKEFYKFLVSLPEYQLM